MGFTKQDDEAILTWLQDNPKEAGEIAEGKLYSDNYECPDSLIELSDRLGWEVLCICLRVPYLSRC